MQDRTHCSDFEVTELRKVLFKHAKCGDDLTKDDIARVNHHLIEFVANYRGSKKGSRVSPNTMRGYIAGIQRSFH